MKNLRKLQNLKGKDKRKIETFVGSKYKVEKVLGEGGFCVVLKARDLDSHTSVAIKRTDTTKAVYKKFKKPEDMEKINELIRREARVMRELNHPNLVRLYECLEVHKTLYLVIEYAEGGELFSRLIKRGKIQEKDCRHIIKQVIAGIHFMHERGFVHRDIKAENILFADKSMNSRVLLTDFGLSREKRDKMYTNCGTIIYSAPELLLNKTTKNGYNYKIDNWSIGVLTFFILSGKLPFGHNNANEIDIKMEIMNGKYCINKPPWLSISNPAKDFIDKLLRPDPIYRMELEEASDHFWISQIFRPQLDNLEIFPQMELNLRQTLVVVRWKVLIYLGLCIHALCKEFKFIEIVSQ